MRFGGSMTSRILPKYFRSDMALDASLLLRFMARARVRSSARKARVAKLSSPRSAQRKNRRGTETQLEQFQAASPDLCG